jgi:hypothetical protein
LNFIKLRKFLQNFLLLFTLALMWGCGGGGGGGGGSGGSGGSGGNSGESTPSMAFGNGASVAIVPLGGGEYVVQGNNLAGVAGMDLTVSYDRANVSSPTVIPGDLISGTTFASNTDLPSAIKIAFIIFPNTISGTGQIAKISFAAHTGPANFTFGPVKFVDTNGNLIQ